MFFGHAFTPNSINYPEDWHFIASQNDLLDNINQLMSEHCDTIYGDVQLNIGELSMCWQAQENRLRKTINMHVNQHQLNELTETLCPLPDPTHQNIYAKLTELPFAKSSIDAVCMCNGLDFTHDPHQLLREVERVVRSDGHLILTGFNPFSPSGLIKHLPFYRSHALHEARFFSHYRVKEWLHVLGFTVKVQRFFGPANMFNQLKGWGLSTSEASSQQPSMRRQAGRLEKPVGRFSPFNSMYFIVAQKTEMPLSLIKPKFARYKPRLQSAQATMRVDTKQQPAQD
jgi:SAM-dependent methyltransferase